MIRDLILIMVSLSCLLGGTAFITAALAMPDE